MNGLIKIMKEKTVSENARDAAKAKWAKMDDKQRAAEFAKGWKTRRKNKKNKDKLIHS